MSPGASWRLVDFCSGQLCSRRCGDSVWSSQGQQYWWRSAIVKFMSSQGFHVHAHINTVNPCKCILYTVNLIMLQLMPNHQFASYRLLWICDKFCIYAYGCMFRTNHVPCTRQYFLNNLLRKLHVLQVNLILLNCRYR